MRIFLTVMVVFAFTACDQVVFDIPADLNEGGVNQKGYFVLNVSNPPSTRTSGNQTDFGSAKESEISSIMVVLTDTTGIIISSFQPAFNKGVTVKFPVETGTYDVYALINKPDNVIVTKDDNIERVIDVAAAADAASGYKGGVFFMVNQRNSKAEKAGVSITINASHSAAKPAEAFIYVDRVACKILDMTTTPDITKLKTATGGVINHVVVMGLAPLNVNKQFNFIQTWNDANADGIQLQEDVLSTPLYPGTGLVTNQYFYNIETYATIEKDEHEEIVGIVDETVGAGFFSKEPIYANENRPTIIANGGSNISAGRGETTGVIYKVQTKKDENSFMGTFYTFKNVFYENLAAIQALQEFNGYELDKLPIPSLRVLGIKVYQNGIMYYTYFIRDPNVAHQYLGKDYYGVFRNSTYQLAISSLSALGDDVPGGAVVDPSLPGESGNPPIEAEDTFLQVSVVVNKWILNTLNITF